MPLSRPSALLADIPTASPCTHEKRISLFRSLFRGREDVFAVRWENHQKETSGDWPKRAGGKDGPAVPLSDWWVSAHLRGTQVIGLYAILEDDSCWFLAVDFDADTWKDDVAAFRETSIEAGLPCAVEISRSGNGAHVWFFFATPVPAAIARKIAKIRSRKKRNLIGIEAVCYDMRNLRPHPSKLAVASSSLVSRSLRKLGSCALSRLITVAPTTSLWMVDCCQTWIRS